MIHIYTGDGKGKSTAALGLAFRASGHGMKTIVLSFLKDGTSGEVKAAQNSECIYVKCCQTEVQGFFWNLSDEEKIKLKTETQRGFLFGMQCADGKRCDILVLDEVAGAISNGLLEEKDVLEFLVMYGQDMEIVMTGRNFPESMIALADYVSEIREVKHPYHDGAEARKGIEF